MNGDVSNIFAVSGRGNTSIKTSYTTVNPWVDGTGTHYSKVSSNSGVSATMSYSDNKATVRAYSTSYADEVMVLSTGNRKYATMGFNCLLISDVSKLISIGTFDSASAKSLSSYAGLFSSANDFVFKFSNKAYGYNNASGDSGSAEKGVTYGSGVD